MRAIHRWFMTVFFVTLLYWAGSGILMAIYDATDAHQVWGIEGGGPGVRLNDAATNAPGLPEPSTLIDGVMRAQSSLAGLAVASVDLRVVGNIVRLQFADAAGNRDTMGRFNALTGVAITQLQAEGNPDEVADYVTKRNNLKSWHRGNAVGMIGQFLGLFTGLGLMALAVTGAWLYWQLWSHRGRGIGLMRSRSFFWKGRESQWRSIHRWVAILSAVFILNIAISGTILAAGEIKLRLFLEHGIGSAPYPRPSPMPPVSNERLPINVNMMLQTAWRAAHVVDTESRVTAIQLVHRDGADKALVTMGGTVPETLAFDAATGAATTDWSSTGVQVGNGYYADWHQFVKRLHRGDVIGHFSGRYLDITAGFALLYLVISGGVMYLQVRAQRARMGAWPR